MKRNNMLRFLGLSVLIIALSATTTYFMNQGSINYQTTAFSGTQIPASYANFHNVAKAGETDSDNGNEGNGTDSD